MSSTLKRSGSGSTISELLSSVPINEDIQHKRLTLSDYIEKTYPFVDFEIVMDNEDTIMEGTLKVLHKIFPERNFANCKTKQYTDGITNKLFKIVTTSDDFPPVLVRVYGKNTEMLIDREQEILTMEILSEAGIAQPIYGRFKNGLCYGFMEGKTFSVDDMRCAVKSPLVAKEMAKFHAVNVIGPAYREPSVFLTILNWVDVATEAEFDNPPANCVSLADLMNEFDRLHAHLLPLLPKAKVGFCHNDLLCKNILYHTPSDGSLSIRFIDYEYGHYNYAAFDIANHFNEWMGYDVEVGRYPNEQEQRVFLDAYVRACRALPSYDPSTNPNHHLSVEEEVKLLYVLSNKFALVSHLFWSIWARVQAVYSDISEFNYYDYANIRYSAYLHFRDPFFALQLK